MLHSYPRVKQICVDFSGTRDAIISKIAMKQKDYKLCRARKYWGDQMLKTKVQDSGTTSDNIKHINNVKIFSDEIKNLKILKYQ